MLHKNARPGYLKLVRTTGTVFFVVEAVLFAGSYAVWYRTNTSRDFRLYLHRNFPSVLSGYYTIGEKLDSENKSRALDLQVWTQEGKLSQ